MLIGDARPLSPDAIRKTAERLGVDEAAIKAVVEIEARDKGFDTARRPVFLFEPHQFYRQLGDNPRAQEEAIRRGLACKKWKQIPYPDTIAQRVEQFEAACELDPAAAICAASWGMGQVMGFNYKLAGFPSLNDFFESMKRSEDDQLIAMANFIANVGLDDELRDGDWARFARGYNGSGYAQNKYDVRLKQAYEKHARDPDAFWRGRRPPATLYRIGSVGPEVKAIHEALKAAGYGFEPAEYFSQETARRVSDFQAKNGLKPDGIVGEKTLGALKKMIGKIAGKVAA